MSANLHGPRASYSRRIKDAAFAAARWLPAPLERMFLDFCAWLAAVLRRLLYGHPTYRQWVGRHDRLGPEDCRAILAALDRLADKPLISIVMPVYNPDRAHLRAALQSVEDQLYPNWELCIADDASTSPHVAAVLAEFAARDARVRVVRRERNGGISAATNSAVALAAGSFIGLLDHDDALPRHALYLVAREIAAHPDADLIYSDEDKLDRRGRRSQAYFKSGWNPDLLYSQNAISHFGVYRTALVRALGGLRSEFDGSQDYDLALRVARATRPEAIRHIPHVLYHWRMAEGSTASAASEKSYALDAARRAVAEDLNSRGVAAEVDLAITGGAPYLQVRYPLAAEPRVSIVIPTRDHAALLSRCVAGLLERTDYRNLELLVVDNQSVEPAALAYLDSIAGDARVRVLRFDDRFNYSAINNWAAAQADGEILVLLNNDTEVIRPDWLRHMVGNAMRPEVGAVGAKLLYPNGRVQHGGVVLTPGGVGGHLHCGLRGEAPGYFGRAVLQQNVSAVTAACLAIRREVYREAGGLDETLRIAFNDVDFCLRLRARGYLIVWTPLAVLHHHESASRHSDLVTARRDEFRAETALMRQRWGATIDDDPYSNPNLVLLDGSLVFADPPRASYPWRTKRNEASERDVI